MHCATNDDEFRRLLANDPEYLLRAALTHDWDTVIAVCQHHLPSAKEQRRRGRRAHATTTTTPLYFSATRIAHQQLLACDQYGNSVLQAACYYRPPCTVIAAVLDAAQRHDLKTHLTRQHTAMDQSTALQVACATGAGVEVLKLLLLDDDENNHSTKSSPSSLSVLTAFDQQGSTPVSELVVQYTLERRGPFHLRRSQPLEQILDVVEECKASTLFRIFWTKLELLLRTAYQAKVLVDNRGKDDESFTMLKGAAALACTCPAVLTTLLLRHSTATNCSDDDNDDTTALRWALEAKAPHPVLQRQLFSFVQPLVARCSAATSTVSYTSVVRKGHAWPIVQLFLQNSNGDDSKDEHGSCPDTALWPGFLQAALHAPDLDTVHGLLRRDPQALYVMQRRRVACR